MIIGRYTAEILGVDMRWNMFKGIPKLNEFLNTDNEWHSLVVGFFHSFYRHRKPPEKYMEEVISKEYHYYTTGRGIGQIVKFTAIVVIAAIIWRKRK